MAVGMVAPSIVPDPPGESGGAGEDSSAAEPAALQFGTAIDYFQLIDALKKAQGARKLTNEALDELTGLQPGYTSKIFGPGQSKRLGPLSMGLMLQGLCVKLVIVEDAAALAKLSERLTKRARPASMRANARTRRATWLMNVRTARKNGRKRWVNVTPEQRRKLAKKAARARWKKQRKKKAAPQSESAGRGVVVR